MRLELSRRAQADLDDIRDYGAEHFGTERTIAYLDGIEQVFHRILAFPQSGPPCGFGDTRSCSADRHQIR